MTISIANAGANHYKAVTNNGGTTVAVALTNPTTAGNLLICTVVTDGAISTPTDNLSGTWILQGSVAAGNTDVALYAKIAASGETTVTAHQGTSTGMVAVVVEWTSTQGAFTALSYTTNTVVNGSTVSNVFTGASVTVNAATDLVFAAAGGDSQNYVFSTDAPWTTPDATVVATGTGVLVTGGDAYQIGVTGSQSPKWASNGSSLNISGVTAAFAEPAGGGGGATSPAFPVDNPPGLFISPGNLGFWRPDFSDGGQPLPIPPASSSDPTTVDPSQAVPPGMFISPGDAGNPGFWQPDFTDGGQPPPLVAVIVDQNSHLAGHDSWW